MALTDQQRAKAQEWLETRTLSCPSCGFRSFSLADIVIEVPFEPGRIVLGGPTYPMLLVVCTECAHALHFAAVPLGLVASEPA